MKCFHCRAITEVAIDGRPICGSAECNFAALEARAYDSLRIPPAMLVETKSPNVTAALAHREHMRRLLYG